MKKGPWEMCRESPISVRSKMGPALQLWKPHIRPPENTTSMPKMQRAAFHRK